MFSKESLPKSGVCPICHQDFKGLKKHFNSCFKNNLNFSQNVSMSSITLNGLKINHPALSIHFDSYQKCEFCDSKFKNLKAKPYSNHLNKKHPGCVSKFHKIIASSSPPSDLSGNSFVMLFINLLSTTIVLLPLIFLLI